MKKRLLATLLSLVLLAGTACASGLDDMLGGYIDLNSDVHYAMSAQIQSLMPYGEETVAMLNGVLRHMSIAAEVTEYETIVDVCVSGDSVLSLREVEAQTGTELTVSLLPNRMFVSSGSAMEALGGTSEVSGPSFDLMAAILQWEDCYQELTDAIIPYAEEKKANYKIKDVAHSKWSRIARLTAEQAEELAPLVEQVLGCGMDEGYRDNLKGLKLSKGFVVGLYQTGEGGDDVAVYMKGYVTLADGVTRAISFQWAFAEDGGVRVDTVKYELTRSKKAASTREVHATLRRRADTELIFKGECETTIKDGDYNVTTEQTYDLSGKESGNVRPVQGEVSFVTKTRKDDKTTTDTTTLVLDMKLTSSEGSGVLSGSVGVEQKTGKVVHTSLTLLFDEEPAQLLSEAAESGVLFAVTDPDAPASSLTQNAETPEQPEEYLVGKTPIGLTSYSAPETMQIIDLDASPDLEPIMGELTQNLAGKLLIALSKLPEEDSALLRDNMSDTDFATFLSMVDGL